MNAAEPHLPFRQRVETAAQLAWRSRMLFELFCVLGREGQFSAIQPALDEYHWFFKLQGHASRFTAFVYMAGLLSADAARTPINKRTINLPDLIDEAVAAHRSPRTKAITFERVSIVTRRWRRESD